MSPYHQIPAAACWWRRRPSTVESVIYRMDDVNNPNLVELSLTDQEGNEWPLRSGELDPLRCIPSQQMIVDVLREEDLLDRAIQHTPKPPF